MTLHLYILCFILITRLWYNLSNLYINTTRGTIFTSSVTISSKFLWLRVFITTVLTIVKILHIVMIGGGYVVKTYPSIDPIVAPPI